MPSREIISRVNRNTPSHAAVPVFSVDVRRCPSISPLIFRAVRHMCTVNVATDAAAVSASTPSHKRLVRRALEQVGGADAQQHRHADAHMHGRNQFSAVALAQIGQADGDDEKRLEALAERDHECLQHTKLGNSFKVRFSLSSRFSAYATNLVPGKQ